jgi:predicted phosphodiesterase
MRVAALNDIHGNVPALEAVLRDVRQARVDRIVVGGDIVVGPMSREALACMLDLDVPVDFLYGNGEVAVMQVMAGGEPARVPKEHQPTIRWTAAQLQPEYETVLASWPKTVTLEIEQLGTVIFCHGTPRDDNEIFTQLTPEDRLLPIFEPLGVPLVVCGHTHMQFDRMVGTTRVVNAGSVGMPFGERGADWLLLGPDVELRHTSYDLEKAAARLRATTYPEDFAGRWILAPPSAAEMLKTFTEYSLRSL